MERISFANPHDYSLTVSLPQSLLEQCLNDAQSILGETATLTKSFLHLTRVLLIKQGKLEEAEVRIGLLYYKEIECDISCLYCKGGGGENLGGITA